MSLHMLRGPNIVVAETAEESDPVIMEDTFSDADVISIQSPNGLAETATLEVSLDFDVDYKKKGIPLATAVAAATWVTADTTFAVLGAADEIAMIRTRYLTCVALRIALSAGAAAVRTFVTAKRCLVY